MPGEQDANGTNTTDTGASTAVSAPADGTAPAPAGQNDTPAGNTATQADGTKPGETTTEVAKPDDKPEAKKDEPQGAPEKYDFKLPEGHTLNPEVQAQFEATARELNMPQDAAQKLVETMGPKIAEAQAAQFAKVQTEWTDAAKADKEYGGQNLEANLAIARSAVDRFGSPELKTFLETTGLGNHPEMIRMMFKAGKSISEDKIVTGDQGSAVTRNQAKSLYPNSN